MIAKFLVLVACLALAHAGVAKRETNALDDIQKHATEIQKTFSEQLNALVNSKNTQEVNTALKEGSDTVLQQLSVLSASLQSALSDATGKAKEALESARANVQKSADELRKAHPEVEQQAVQLKEKLQAAVSNAVQETQKLAKEVSSNVEETNKKLEPKVKQAYDDLVKNVQEVQKKLHEAANKQ
ncbi:apolipophorin-3-like [Plodia interpunctella]|uniref:apolipophorin-3-like n=1 Tax=Plodia interpunctella TaxID=58824 RepID=UPI002367AABC|nr:apolipophorin-3-like [Plodia interpunctella]